MVKTKYEGLYYRLDKNNNKVYVARIYHNGKETKKTLGKEPAINAKTANRLRLEYIESLDKYNTNGLRKSSKRCDVLFEEYLALRKNSISESWYYSLTLYWRKHLSPKIGDKQPKDITRAELQKIVNDMLDNGYAPATVKLMKGTLTTFFAVLPDLGVAGVENIGKKITLPKFDNTRYFNLSDEQNQKLIDTIFNYENEKFKMLFSWLTTGRRKSEISKIRWEDIDFENMTYTINYELMKNKETMEFVLPKKIYEMLKKYGIKDEGFVFPQDRNANKPVSQAGIDYHWKNIRAISGITDINIHDLRHLVGTNAVNMGFTLEQIGKALGHKSIMSTKRYSNTSKQSANEVVEAIYDKFA